MGELERRLNEASGTRRTLIVTDGVFSMDGYIAPLDRICELAEQYGALVMVDDSHAVGFVGPGGRGTHELHGVMDRVDIVTGTLGKALGGASGGEHGAVPLPDDAERFRDPARRAPDRPGHARRRRAGGKMAERLLGHGVYAVGFSYPVVPHGRARIWVQLSAAHSANDVQRAVAAFVAARASLPG
jgi:glycine C-acetyltransferase